MRTQMLMHVITHGGCTDTVSESALEVYAGREIVCHTLDSKPAWLLHLAFQLDFLLTELSFLRLLQMV